MSENNNERSLIEDLIDIKLELTKSSLKKSGKNSYQNFEYFELADFMPTVLKLLAAKKIFIKFDIKTLEDSNEYAVLTAMRGMEKVVQVLPTAEPSGNNPIQQAGSKFTYMRRYSYLTFFDLCEADTVDNRDQNEVKKTAVKYATQFQIEKIYTNAKLIAEELASLKITTKNDVKHLTLDKASELCGLIDKRNEK